MSYLDLPVVTDGLDGDGGPDGAVGVARPELDDGFGAAHQPGHRGRVLQQLLLLLLGGGARDT